MASGEDCGGDRGRLGGEKKPFGDPFFAAAINEAHIFVAVIFQLPEGVGGEPVVVVAVKEDDGVFANTGFAEQALEFGLFDEIATDRVLELGLPVPGNGAGNVALVVGRGVN